MKPIILTLLSIIISYNYSFSQHKVCVDVIKNEAGKYYILYSDSTWQITTKTTFDVYNTVRTKTENKSVTNNANHLMAKPTQSSNTSIISGKTSTISTKSRTSTTLSTSSICGARTKKGGSCQRRVVGGGYCYQHR